MPAALALPEIELPDTHRMLFDRGLFARELDVRNNSVNAEDRSFEAVAATETPAVIFDYRTYEFIDEILVTKGGQFPDHMPLLPNHRRFDVLDVIGSVIEPRMDASQWIVRGEVARGAREDSDVNEIWQRVLDRHIRAVSIGYQVNDFVDIKAGSTQSIDGRRFTANERTLRISTEWRAHELSLTPIGADEMALIRSRLGRKPKPKRRSIFR